jgi:hypothetical protein
MCAENPGHTDDYVTSGKIISIGGIYAASPERGSGNTPATGDNLPQAIAKQLRSSSLDEQLASIGFDQKITDQRVLDQVICAHAFLVKQIRFATEQWPGENRDKDKWKARNQTSFASKYLHFHRPNAFPIMDSLARAGLNCAGRKGAFPTYSKFCETFLEHVLVLNSPWTPRDIDTVLVKNGRKHGQRTCTFGCKICNATKKPPNSTAKPA